MSCSSSRSHEKRLDRNQSRRDLKAVLIHDRSGTKGFLARDCAANVLPMPMSPSLVRDAAKLVPTKTGLRSRVVQIEFDPADQIARD